MHVFFTPFKGTAPNASILMGVELRGRDMQLSQNDSIQLSYMAIDVNGKIRGGNTDSLTMTALKPETKARIEQTGLRLLNRVDLPPGKYQVRVAAQDAAGGNVGAIQAELEVPDFAKSAFSVSGLVLTSASGAALPTAHPDEQLKAVMPGPPVARRTFAQNDEITLFAEVYDNEGKTPHKVDITSTVTTDEGKVMFKTDETRDSSDLGGKNGGYGYTARIPMKDLAPGRYVLKVEAKSRLKNTPRYLARSRVHRGAGADADQVIGRTAAHSRAHAGVASRRAGATAPCRATGSVAPAGAGAFVNIDKGTQSNVDEGRKVTVRSEADWTLLWQQHDPDRPRPSVDFSKQMVVGVFMGSRTTAGFAVEIVSATDG